MWCATCGLRLGKPVNDKTRKNKTFLYERVRRYSRTGMLSRANFPIGQAQLTESELNSLSFKLSNYLSLTFIRGLNVDWWRPLAVLASGTTTKVKHRGLRCLQITQSARDLTREAVRMKSEQGLDLQIPEAQMTFRDEAQRRVAIPPLYPGIFQAG